MFELYQRLNVKNTASSDEIRQAFRKLAKETHPDLNANNSEKIEEFRKIKEAYDILSDEEKRAKYDADEKQRNMPLSPKTAPDVNDVRYQVLDWIDKKAHIKRWCQYRFFSCCVLIVLLFILYNMKNTPELQRVLYMIKLESPIWIALGLSVLLAYQFIRLIIDEIRFLYYRHKIKKMVKSEYYRR